MDVCFVCKGFNEMIYVVDTVKWTFHKDICTTIEVFRSIVAMKTIWKLDMHHSVLVE